MIKKVKLSAELINQLFGANSPIFKSNIYILERLFKLFKINKSTYFNDWKEKFLTQCNRLEVVYAFLIYEKRKEFNIQDKIEIKEAIANLIKLVETKILPDNEYE